MHKKAIVFIGTFLAILFLIGLSTTLTRSPMIGFWDVLPVKIIMGLAIGMMLVEACENLDISLVKIIKKKFFKKK
jgi:hypothetical protein